MRITSTLLIAICIIISSIGNVFAAQVDPILAHAMPIVRTADGDTIPCFSIKIQPVIAPGQQEPLCPNYGLLTIVAVDSLTGNKIPNLSYTWYGESVYNLSAEDTSFIAIIPHWCNHLYEVHLSVTDTLNGCTATATYTLDVRDTLAPVVQDGVLENRKVLPTSEGKYYIPDFISLLTYETVSDNCCSFAMLTINQYPTAGTEFSETTTVTITLSGPCGEENQYFVQVEPWALDTICFPNTSCSGYSNATLGINNIPIGFSCTFQNSTRLSEVHEGSLAIENTIIFDFCQIGVWPLQITDLYGNTVEYSVTIRESLNYPEFGINEILVTQPTCNTSGQITIDTVVGFSYWLFNAQLQEMSGNNLPEGTYTLEKSSLVTGCATDTVIHVVVDTTIRDGQPCPCTPTVTDVDGNTYNTVKIGNQCWLKENLRTTHYADGTAIPDGGTSSSETFGYRYDDTTSTIPFEQRGYHYNWPAVMHGALFSSIANSTGICPTGWHIPSYGEWTELIQYVESHSNYWCSNESRYIAKSLASTTWWNSSTYTCSVGNAQSSNNAIGFSAVPAGCHNGSGFYNSGLGAIFWGSTKYSNSSGAFSYSLFYNTSSVVSDNFVNNSDGCSVRCLRDAFFAVIDDKFCPAAPTVTDHEGNVYATVQIGNQCWMRDNLRTTTSPSTGTYLVPEANAGYTYTGKQARWLNNDSTTYAPNNFGLLYNWNAAVDTFNTAYGETSVNDSSNNSVSITFSGNRRGICPEGWHLPSDAEWTTMTSYVMGQSEYACRSNSTYIAKALVSETGWVVFLGDCSPGIQYNATGFSAFPTGRNEDGAYSGWGYDAYFWTSTEHDSSSAYSRNISWLSPSVNRLISYKKQRYSVRCLRDEGNTSSLPTVTTGLVASVSYTSATSGGDVISDGGSTVTARGVCWSNSPSPTVSDSHTSDGNGMGSFNSYISGLIPNTTYYVRAYATNSVGTAYGEQVTFTTPVNPNGDGQPCSGAPTVTDIDGNVYNTVQIGAQCWMKENLRTTKYADGTTILQGSINDYFPAHYYYQPRGFWSYPNNDSTNKQIYGLLYNWKAVMGANTSSDATPSGVQGICPTGWHVPSNAEWTILTDYVSNQSDYICGYDSSQIGKALSSTIGWDNYSEFCSVGYNQSSNNSSAFGAMPAGYYYSSGFQDFGRTAHFWASTKNASIAASCRVLSYMNATVPAYTDDIQLRGSVRCLRDEGYASLLPTVTTDSVYNLTTASAFCGGKVTSEGYAAVTERGVCWGISHNPTVSSSHTIEGNDNGSFFSCITGLASNLTYFTRAYATNSYGTVYGEEISFTTPVNPNGDGYSCPGAPTVTDIDGNVYNTVQIGAQCWMRENLRTTKFTDGTTIPQGNQNSDIRGYWSYPNRDSTNKQTYGLLYNWKAVMGDASSSDATPSGVQGICPTGWHVPSDAEWTILTDYLGGQRDYICDNDSLSIAKALAYTMGWYADDINYCSVGNNQKSNNSTKFGAMPAGQNEYIDYGPFGYLSVFWSSTLHIDSYAYTRSLHYLENIMYRGEGYKYAQNSLRCLRDEGNSSLLPTVTTDSVFNITANSAFCGSNVTSDGGSPITARGVCWNTEHNPTILDSHTNDGYDTGSFTSNIMDLAPNTTYYVRAYATNQYGTVYGEELSFTTPCPVISINGPSYIHLFGEITLMASGGDNYVWNTGDSSSTITVTPNGTVTYSVTGTDDYGCIGSTSKVVTTYPSINPTEAGTGLTDIEVDCNNPSVTLCANVIAKTTTDYTVESIPFNPPFDFTEGTRRGLDFDGIDDRWGSSTNLPFWFSYYGWIYTHIVPGSNSVASFGYHSGECNWRFSDSIPSSNLFTNTIFACYRDIDTRYFGTNGGVFDSVYGEWPNRCYKLSFNNIGLFNDNAHSPTFSSMIVLYEGTNIIEIYLRDAPTNTSWNNGNGVLGLQNSTGTKGITPPGRNTGPWTAHEEAWRFIPVADSNYTVTWYLGTDTTLATGIIVGTGDTITVSPQESTDYTARLQYTDDCENSFTIAHTCHVTVNREGPNVTVNASQNELCEGDNTTLTATGADTYLWSTGEEGANIIVTPNSTTTYYVTASETTTGCTATASATVAIKLPTFGDTSCVACDSFDWYEHLNITQSCDNLTHTFPGGNAAGCDSIVTLHLTVHPTPDVTISGPHYLCQNSFVTLTATASSEPEFYIWSNGVSSALSTISEPGVYTVTAFFANGCSAVSTDFHVFHSDNPIVDSYLNDMVAGDTQTVVIGTIPSDNLQYATPKSTITNSTITFLHEELCGDPPSCSNLAEMTFSGFPDSAVIHSAEDIRYIRLNMEHSALIDLYISLSCPNGQHVDILKKSNASGGSSTCLSFIEPSHFGWPSGNVNEIYFRTWLGQPNILSSENEAWYRCDTSKNKPGIGWNYCWSNNTTENYQYASGDGVLVDTSNATLYGSGTTARLIIDSSNVAAGTQFYHPQESFDSFVGCPINGTWTVEIIDGLHMDNGYLFTAELSLMEDLLETHYAQVSEKGLNGQWVTRTSDSTFIITPPESLANDTTLTYSFTLVDEYGCTFDTSLAINVFAHKHIDLYDTIPASLLPYTWDGLVFNSAGCQNTVHQTFHGADSVVTMHLSVVYHYDTVVCDNTTPLYWHNLPFSGTSSVTIAHNLGCADSIEVMVVTVNHSHDSTLFVSVLENDLPYYLNGHPCYATGIYTDTLLTVNGCESILTLYLTVLHNVQTEIDSTICSSQLPFIWNDSIYLQSGDYTQQFSTVSGSDSIVTLHLTVLHSDTTEFSQICCYDYTWNGITYSATGDYFQALINQYGCDSLVIMHLTVYDTVFQHFAIEACNQYIWNGINYTTSGDYAQTFVAVTGCDSIVTLHLTINPTPEVSIIGDSIICPNGAIMLTATGADNYLWSNGSTNSFIPVNQFGIYRVTGTSATGCANTDSITVLVAQPPAITISGITDLCAGDTSIITVHGGTSYLWDNGSTDSVMTVSDAGIWQVIGYDENGCNSMTSVNVNIWQPTVSEFSVFCPDSCYIWNSQTYCESGDYTQTLQTTYGCDSIVTLHLTITVGINDHDGFDFKVYPNPTSNIVNVECIMKNEDWGEMELHLCDAYGRLLDVVGANNHSPLRTARIDLSQYANGVYFVKAVVDGKTIAVRKVVKQ